MPAHYATDLSAFRDGVIRRVDRALAAALPEPDEPPSTLARAMRHSVFAGGKRFRPALVYAAAEFGRAEPNALDDAAAAVELIHTYSLIHDDLPAMDNDDLRRGKPTCHVVFGEANAILAGDALQALAFEVLTRSSTADADRRFACCRVLARASGASGLVGGQTADLEAERSTTGDLASLRFIHERKTGALLTAAVTMGALMAGLEADAVQRVADAGRHLGLAFQIADDLLDIEATSGTLGKTAGKDAASGKLTYPSLLGLEASRLEAERSVVAAEQILHSLGAGSSTLAALARYVIERRN